MANIINAIINLVNNPIISLTSPTDSNNRANSMGESFELYIKDLFADTVGEKDESIRIKKQSEVFSYLGNSNSPPDSILMGGDAIEMKKIEGQNSQLALNSSYPKAKLYSESKMISNACRDCEKWSVKDMLYTVGVVENKVLKSLAFVYGEDYCADKEVYEKIKTTIKEGVQSIGGVEFAETNELGKINRIDPLGITYLRVRGMWGIENPFKVFSYLYQRNFSNAFNFMCIINNEKYNSFENRRELEAICLDNGCLSIKDVKIKDPNNPAKLKDCKLITYKIENNEVD